MTGHLRIVALLTVTIILVTSLALVGWGFIVASRNPYLRDLVALGA